MTLIVSSLEITPEILGLVTEIDEFKVAWRARGLNPGEDGLIRTGHAV